MIFCSVVMVSSNAPGRALRHPDRSAPRLGLLFAVGIRTPLFFCFLANAARAD
jgi:hypothetical protein